MDKLQAVLGNDPALAALMQELGALFRPVLTLDGSDASWTQTAATLDSPCTIETWVRLDPKGRKIGNADGILRAPGAEDRRIPRAEIRDATYLRRSLMPEGLLDTMGAEQVSDLFAYLKTLK